MGRKLKSKKGFTLAEALIAVAILAIFVSMAAVGTSALFGTGEEMMAVSKAAVLGSDVLGAVTNEIRFGVNFKTNTDGTLTYTSSSYGEGCTIKIDEKGYEGQFVIVQTASTADEEGNLISHTNLFLPVGSAAYDEVWIKALTFTIQEDSDTVEVKIAIKEGDEKVLWEQTAHITPLVTKVY